MNHIFFFHKKSQNNEILFSRFLDVTSARLSAVENHVFDGLHELESLWLDENRIGLLPKSIFCGLEHLKELNLNSNRFAHFAHFLLENETVFYKFSKRRIFNFFKL